MLTEYVQSTTFIMSSINLILCEFFCMTKLWSVYMEVPTLIGIFPATNARPYIFVMEPNSVISIGWRDFTGEHFTRTSPPPLGKYPLKNSIWLLWTKDMKIHKTHCCKVWLTCIWIHHSYWFLLLSLILQLSYADTCLSN